MTMFKQKLTQDIINKINIYQQHLEIAKKIDLKNLILKSMVEVEVWSMNQARYFTKVQRC
jgi:hypothetical protein